MLVEQVRSPSAPGSSPRHRSSCTVSSTCTAAAWTRGRPRPPTSGWRFGFFFHTWYTQLKRVITPHTFGPQRSEWCIDTSAQHPPSSPQSHPRRSDDDSTRRGCDQSPCYSAHGKTRTAVVRSAVSGVCVWALKREIIHPLYYASQESTKTPSPQQKANAILTAVPQTSHQQRTQHI